MKKRLPVMVLWALCLAAAAAALPKSYSMSCEVSGLQIDTGHQGAITCLEYDHANDRLFSASRDGTLRVWRGGKQLAALRISHLPIRMFALHPELPRVAVVEVESSSRARIGVWDWEDAEPLYDIELAEAPLFVGFSPQGTYLLYGVAETQSLKIYEARTGRETDYLRRVYGLVTFAALSQSESNVMTYQPSGRISYWKLKTGEKIREVETRNDLTLVRIPWSDNRYLSAKRGESLVVVDTFTGQVKALEPLPNIVDLAVSPRGDRIACLTTDHGKPGVSYWNFTGSFLYPGTAYEPWEKEAPPGLSHIVLSASRLYAGEQDGALWRFPAYSQPQRLSENHLLPISAIEARENVVVLGSEQGIVVFDLSVNEAAYRTEDVITDFDFGIYSNPFSSRVGLEVFSAREMLLWDRSERLQGIAFLDAWTGIESRVPVENKVPLTQVDTLPNSLLTLDRNGRIRIIEELAGLTLFEYTSPGIKKVVPVSEDWLVGAGNRTTPYSGALVRVNRRTKETVPLRGPRLLAYDLVYDPVRDVLYSLSIVRSGEETVTAVAEHRGPDFENERLVFEYRGEDLSASLHFDCDNAELYTSVGYGPVRVWNGRSTRSLEESCHVPRSLVSAGRLVYSLNQDSTVSIWDRRTGKLLADLYIFRDLSWAAVFPGENAYLSQDADEHLLLPEARRRFPF